MVVSKSVLNFVRWRIFEKFSPNPLPPYYDYDDFLLGCQENAIFFLVDEA